MTNLNSVVGEHPHGSVLTVWVVPGARRSEMVGVHNGGLRIRIAAPPSGGQANKAVIRFLRSATGARVDLLSGASARHKRLLVRDTTPTELRTCLDGILGSA